MVRGPARFFCALCAATLASASPLHAARIVERIIARVNNEIVTQRQFDRELDKIRQQLAQQYSGADLENAVRTQSKDVLRDLIDQALMVQKAKDLDLNVETDLVKREDQIRQSMNLASIQDLEKEVEKQGIVWEDYQDEIRRNLQMREVIGREVGGRIIISHEDARKYFQEHQQQFASPAGVRLAEILISNEKRKPEEAEARAKQVSSEVKAGAKWHELVKKYTDGPSADEGGDVGFFKDGTLAPAIAEPVAKLDVNESTDPIHTKDGYVILRVMERRSAGVPKFEEVEQRVNELMYDQQIQSRLRDYLTTLRKESYIFIAPGYIDTGMQQPGGAVLAKKDEE